MQAVSGFEELARCCAPYVRAERIAAVRAELGERPDAGASYVVEALAAVPAG